MNTRPLGRTGLQVSTLSFGASSLGGVFHDVDEKEAIRAVQSALDLGINYIDAVSELKQEGRIGAVSFGIYPMDLWQRILTTLPVDAALVHNHYSLHDTRLLDLLPVAKEKGIGLINASPFGSGLLTDRGPADWHPANAEQRAVFKRAADFCAAQGTSISKLALQFSSQHPDIPTTMFSSANAGSVKRNIAWAAEPYDPALVAVVRDILKPVTHIDWFP
jgi:L-galactose dehydrogenase